MTHQEAKTALLSRVEWQMPLDPAFSYLSFDAPESDRFLQEEHTGVSIPIIKKTIAYTNISNEEFQTHLDELKEKAIMQMLHDVFSDKGEINDTWVTDNTSLFDYAIILRNTISVLNDILNSTNINLLDTVVKSNIKTWYIDLNGINDKENGLYVKGFISRYKREIERIRKVLFIQKKSLKTVTAWR